ncbi:hypothetical protein LC896_14565, partial [Enterococcus faecium]|nr:hypothetical protein [Enterococcus faecium]MCH3540671.1 hypothetical protein [Enterococcus faecium]
VIPPAIFFYYSTLFDSRFKTLQQNRSHYDMMKNFDLIVLAPQVNSYLDDLRKDADKLGIKVIATKGAEYINLTRDPKGAVDFVLKQF